MNKLKITFLIILLSTSVFSQTKPLILKGIIVDSSKEPLPYVAISILEKSKGTSTNDDGEFVLKLTESYLNDMITISTIGFKTLKIKVSDYVNQKENVLVLKEEITSLGEITLINPESYVKDALKNINKTRYKKGHQLNILYRRFSTENKVSRFLVEHYMKIYDSSPTTEAFDEMQVVEGRKSADYRFIKMKQNFHAVKRTALEDPLRIGIYRKEYKWKIVDDTSYDGEDLIVIEGRKKKSKNSFVRLYIGMDTKGIYKLETSRLSGIYIYKKRKDGKLILSYHQREYKTKKPISLDMQRKLNLSSNKISLSYRHEFIVLDIITEKDKMDVSHNYKKGKDIGDYKIKYNPVFWQNLNLPPASKFYKKNVKELESIYGVPLEAQFKVVN